jgi:hypothetical protein
MAMFLNVAFCALLFIAFPIMAFIGYRNQDLRNLYGGTRQGGQQENLLLQIAKTAALIFLISFFYPLLLVPVVPFRFNDPFQYTIPCPNVQAGPGNKTPVKKPTRAHGSAFLVS